MDDDPSFLARGALLLFAAPSLWKHGFIVAALLCAKSFLAAMEAGFFALSRTRMRLLAERGERSFRIAVELLDDPRRLLATTLTATTLFLLAAQAIATHAAIENPGLAWFPLVALPFVAVTFGDIIPTLYALQKPETVVRLGAPVVYVMNIAMGPFVLMARRLISNRTESPLSEETKSPAGLTKEDIRTVVAVAEEQGEIPEHEREMIHSAMEFDKKRVSEVMVPHRDVVMLRGSATIEDALKTIIDCQHSRLPVNQDLETHITGVVYAKDLIPFVREGRMQRTVQQVARAPYFISNQMQIDELFRDLQQRRRLMAIVVAPDGTAEGIVTMEDLLEEIVGEILDEYDIEEPHSQPTIRPERIP